MIASNLAQCDFIPPPSAPIGMSVPQLKSWFQIVEIPKVRDSTATKVREFIRQYKGVSFTEIAKGCDLARGRTGSYLQRLQLRGEVRRTGERGKFLYWIA